MIPELKDERQLKLCLAERVLGWGYPGGGHRGKNQEEQEDDHSSDT